MKTDKVKSPIDLERTALWAVANRQKALRLLDKADAQDSLIKFIELLWPVVEPGRPLIRGWAMDAICEHLEAITKGQIKRLVVNVPPGFCKSLISSVFWPAWEWGPKQRPSLRYICASYAEHLTIRDNRKALALIRSPIYQELWGDVFKLDPDQQAKTKFDNTSTGWKLATSVSGTGTGERGDRFIIDDPHNVKEGESEAKRTEALQWFTEVVPTRVNDPNTAAMIIIMQRVHEEDISGHILASKLEWDHLCIPMSYEPDHPHKSHTAINFVDPRQVDGELAWPERFSRDYLEKSLYPEISSWGGDYAVAGQFQQRPAPRGGGMFQRDKFQFVNANEVPTSGKRVRGWDLAATKDAGAYTASVKMFRTSNGDIYIEDVRRKQLSANAVYQLIKSCAREDGFRTHISLPQDPGQAGKSQKSQLALELEGYDFSITTESGAKEDRARPLAAQVEAGKVYLVRAPWNVQFLAEVESFPMGKYKDQVDAASRAYAKLILQKARPMAGAPELIDPT